MSWFKYSDQTTRRYRKGIWLRIRDLPIDLMSEIESNLNSDEQLAWVVVQELQPQGRVLLEIWCTQLKALPVLQQQEPQRYTVFHLSVPENPEWICEGDLGRGLVVGRSRRG